MTQLVTRPRAPFRSPRRFYERNLYDSQVATAVLGIIETPDGGEEITVAVLAGGHARLMLTPTDALRVATQIVETLDVLKKKEQ